jgi:glyoxylase-like metal-dependent hydrolase (beta-lactamase superfamily II)
MTRKRTSLAFMALGIALLGNVISAAQNPLFDFKPVADGVYAAVAKPTFRTNCNSAIVILDNAVLVVDAQSKPSAAEAVIAEVKRLTDKPVEYLVLTHFHNDHTQGVQAYIRNWPGVKIISTPETRDSIAQRTEARLERDSVTLPKQIDKMKLDLAQADGSEKSRLKKQLNEAEAYLEEMKQIHLIEPNLLVDDRLELHVGPETVEMFSFRHAHTDGDLVVYLPSKKVLISGDIIHGAQPITKDGYLVEWTAAIGQLEKLDFETVIGGHGDILHDRTRFDLWQQYFTDLLHETAQSVASGESLDAARKRIVPILLPKYGPQFPKRFSDTIKDDIDKAFRTVSGQTE